MAKWKGAESLRGLLVPVTSIVPHPENPRRGDLDLIAESLGEFGQLRPILVNVAAWRVEETGSPVIVAGNHTYRAGVERLEWDEIARVSADLSPSEEERYLIADNRTSDRGDYYDEVLARILGRIKERGELAGTGWTSDEVERFQADAAALAKRVTPPEPPPGFPAVDPEDEAHPTTVCPRCGLRF